MAIRETPVISGSSAFRRINCRGSYFLEKALPKANTTSPWAEVGTALHEVMEYLLAHPEEPEESVIGMTFNEIQITEEHFQNKVWPAMRAVDELRDLYGEFDYWTELNLTSQQAAPGCTGTMDLLIRPPGSRLVTADFKFGDGVTVKAQENYQLAFYTLLARESNMTPVRGVDTYTFAIIQPKEDDPTLDLWTTDNSFLSSFRLLVHDAFRAITEEKDTTRNPGKWCRFCSGKALCPEYTQLAEEHVARGLPDHQNITGIELADLKKRARVARAWADSVDKLAHNAALNGVHIPGFGLYEVKTPRRWADGVTGAEIGAILKSPEDAYVTKLKTAPQVAKIVPKERKADFEKMVTREVTGLTLKPLSTKGQPVRLEGSAEAASVLAAITKKRKTEK